MVLTETPCPSTPLQPAASPANTYTQLFNLPLFPSPQLQAPTLSHSHSISPSQIRPGYTRLVETTFSRRPPPIPAMTRVPYWGPWLGVPMSHVDFKKWQCHMSLSLLFLYVICRIYETRMSYNYVSIFWTNLSHVTNPNVRFKKWPCRPVKFRGRGPSYSFSWMSPITLALPLPSLPTPTTPQPQPPNYISAWDW